MLALPSSHLRLREVAVPISAVDSISPAFHHTQQQLFRPFSFGQWTRIALVGLFAGEMTSGGCNFNMPSSSGAAHRQLAAFPDAAAFGALFAVLLVMVPILWLAFLYLSSRMRFVLFDSIIARRCEVQRFWHARRGPALQFLVWQIVLSLVALAAIAVVVGVPALIAFTLGWFENPRAHLAQLVPFGLLVVLVFAGLLIAAVIIHVFTKDFVVPQMAIEGVSAFEGWRRLLAMLRNEKAGYAGYAGMKLVMALGAAVAVGIAAAVLFVVLLIPIGGLGAITVLTGMTAGLTWNVFTITAAIVAGCTLLVILFYIISLVSVPVIVFFPAYATYFFAARYPKLASLIYPAPPQPPPPLVPSPEPAG
jgi:hypothetical protein